MNDLVRIDGYCQLEKTGLTFKRDVSKEEWMNVFKSLKAVEGCVQFWLGDCLAYRQQKWGMYDDVAEETGYEKNQLRDYRRISESVKSAERSADLGYCHHREVASLPPAKQQKFLQKAVDEKLSVRDLRRAIHADEYQNKLKACNIPSGKYHIFYADPPWTYGNDRTYFGGDQASHYPSMSIEELC